MFFIQGMQTFRWTNCCAMRKVADNVLRKPTFQCGLRIVHESERVEEKRKEKEIEVLINKN